MPLYEYRCESCGRTVEILQRMGTTSAGIDCPACRAPRLVRALSTFASPGAATAGGGTGETASCAPSGAFS